MEKYETRISNLEAEMNKKCSEDQVRGIVSEELHKNKSTVEKKEETQAEPRRMVPVINEMNERKAREGNLVIYGFPECDSTRGKSKFLQRSS